MDAKEIFKAREKEANDTLITIQVTREDLQEMLDNAKKR